MCVKGHVCVKSMCACVKGHVCVEGVCVCEWTSVYVKEHKCAKGHLYV